ncbi:hypothetical protein Ancab_031562 [Ancistrocladus abbreviatus]
MAMLPEDLGIGMALASTTCDPLPSAPTMMTSLAVPEGIHNELFHVPQPTLEATTDGIQDAHSSTLLTDENQRDDEG